MSCTLNRYRKRSLVLRAVSGDSSGKDLTSLRDVSAQLVAVLVVDYIILAAEYADFLSSAHPSLFLGDMAQAINDYAKQNGYSIVREIGGHGIGLEFHEEPFVSYVTRRGTEMLMVPGMVFTIEPMVNMGKADIYIDDEDGWTVYTDDSKPSAQWEVTLAVTEDGYEILTY